MVLKFPSIFKSEVSKEATSTSPQPAFFNNAKNTQITGGFFSININQTVDKIVWFVLALLVCGLLYSTSSHNKWVHKQEGEATSSTEKSLKKLNERVAMNAVLNEGGRVDNPKCHPGTREEVISLIEQWMGTRNDHNGFLWLSGPAGGGKTAIMKTIAERSKDQGVSTVNFFFFRGDSTRNSAQSFVATLVYQILLLYPATRPTVVSILSANPLILDASIQELFQELIAPLSNIIRESSPGGRPLVLLIDGLDECDGQVKRSQEYILRALESLVTQDNSPFLALVASRPEPRIQMAFNQLASKSQSISLDGQYLPAEDIRLFVTAEFDRIKVSHPNAHGVPHKWPSRSDIEAIVSKSSGQFIYAATVMRFLEYSSAVPSISLERVHGIVPAGRNSPFAYLDSVYIHILNQTEDFEATQDILSSKLLDDHSPCRPDGTPQGLGKSALLWQVVLGSSCRMDESAASDRPVPPVTQHCFPPIQQFLSDYHSRYTNAMVNSALSDLVPIAHLRDQRLVFYHASLVDFLQDPSRSNNFHVDLGAFAKKIFPAIWMSVNPKISEVDPPPVGWRLIHKLQETTPAITKALLLGPIPDCRVLGCLWYKTDFYSLLGEISRLYYPHNIEPYHQILRKWTTWAVDRYHIPDSAANIPLLDTYFLLAKIETSFTPQKWITLVASTLMSYPPYGVLFLNTCLSFGVKMEKWFTWGSHSKVERLKTRADLILTITGDAGSVDYCA